MRRRAGRRERIWSRRLIALEPAARSVAMLDEDRLPLQHAVAAAPAFQPKRKKSLFRHDNARVHDVPTAARRARTRLGSFFKLFVEAFSAQAGPAGDRRQRRQRLAPAVILVLPAVERDAAAGAALREFLIQARVLPCGERPSAC